MGGRGDKKAGLRSATYDDIDRHCGYLIHTARSRGLDEICTATAQESTPTWHQLSYKISTESYSANSKPVLHGTYTPKSRQILLQGQGETHAQIVSLRRLALNTTPKSELLICLSSLVDCLSQDRGRLQLHEVIIKYRESKLKSGSDFIARRVLHDH